MWGIDISRGDRKALIWGVAWLTQFGMLVDFDCLLSCFASSLLWCLCYWPLVTGLLTTFLLFFLLVATDTTNIIITTAHLEYPCCLWDWTVHLWMLLDRMVLWLVCVCVFGLRNERSGAGLRTPVCWTHGPSVCCAPAISAFLFWNDFITGAFLFQSQSSHCSSYVF